MIQHIEAVFDGNVFRPTTPLELEPNTRVRITVENTDGLRQTNGSFLDTTQSLNLDGPTDWSKNIDAYLYGGHVDTHE